MLTTWEKLERIAKELAEANNLSLLIVANIADVKNDIKALLELEKHRGRILESINLVLDCQKEENIVQFIDLSLEVLLFAIDYAERKGIVLPNYSKLIDEALQLLEELPPHLQHHRYNTQRRDRTYKQ
ncbi:hypothetical protein DRO97_06405 [Archaeoglobales archaeon]|nr:MAG: hypothetical protein DRO97_06405 [Archaeoglobales archaeon]